jgi:hypothetical protein
MEDRQGIRKTGKRPVCPQVFQLEKDAVMESAGGTLSGANAGALSGQTLKLKTIEERPF